MTSGDSSAPRTDRSGSALCLLRQMVEAACAALEEAAQMGRDVGSRRAQLAEAETHLDQAARLLERGRQELTTVAAEIVRASLPDDACGMPWPVCSRCLGTGLTASAGSSWCPSCGRSGGAAAARSAHLCTERATVTVRDEAGDKAAMCLSHAAGAVRDVAGLTVIDATDDEVQALFVNSDRPIRVDTSKLARRFDLFTLRR